VPKLTGQLNMPYYAVLGVFNGDPDVGIAGLSCAIDYDDGPASGVDVLEWRACGNGLQFPQRGWPAARTGNIITLLDCETDEPDGDGVTAIFGFFYVIAYSPDRMSIVERTDLQSGPELKVAECEPPVEYELDPEEQAGYVGFSNDGSEEGRLPCVEKSETTWGRIKNTYNN
jgi:hypothetical protein